ncbi:MAG: substrate import-associated zinc metallohydrolase lipoprotein [Cyclobacteriaceae bacterium]|jgi:substrate import-associated zinc metallohydrolase lipoprotein
MKKSLQIFQSCILVAMAIIVVGCYPDETLNVDETETALNMTVLDQYIEEEFTEEYGMAIRYRYVDRYVNPGERVAPPRESVVRPMLEFIQNFWIDPYLQVENGEAFFREHVPAEIVFLGGLIYNSNGTVTLGTADAGAQITFTNVNAIDTSDLAWKALQLRTVYHEFAHTVHQRYKLPSAFETISPLGYTSAGSWFTLDDDDAIRRGFTSPYATSSPNEDFAETVSFYLFEENFFERYVDMEEDCQTAACEERNAGRVLIAEKIATISSHYKKVTNVDLEELRTIILAKQ